MKREIKFRIFDGQKMINPEVVDFEREQSMDYYNWYDGYYGESYKFDKYPLLQFTGLKDKNGKEIYEGDIVHQEGYLIGFYHTVVFYDSRFCLVKGGIHTDYIPHPGIEVIGNIYENLELLKS